VHTLLRFFVLSAIVARLVDLPAGFTLLFPDRNECQISLGFLHNLNLDLK
jgi:hypothetical protein